MSAASFEVHAYDLATLIRLTAGLSHGNTEEAISRKSHPSYLESYFKELGVKTIVVERNYVDRDYLDDFAEYYVRCFQAYERHCSRLHFFATEFTAAQFEALLRAEQGKLSAKDLQEHYCGFIVIKPLPQTVFGRTCLKTYPAVDGRAFPVTRAFSAHLFGITLTINDTLPFQEQDAIVAACATSALWSVLQATAKEFQHEQLTPIEITKAATEFLPAETRMIPNRRGLSTAMMAEAIRSVRLEPVMMTAMKDEHVSLRALIYAYLKARIPMILGISLCDTAKQPNERRMGEHAVAVTGFKLQDQPAPAVTKTGLRLRAARIKKIYAHDDQVGPFARMVFDEVTVESNLDDGNGVRDFLSISTTWCGSDGTNDKVRAIPLILLVPLYHKIRIPYEDIIEVVTQFHEFLAAVPPLNAVAGGENFEWDIHLATVNDLKADLQCSEQLEGAQRLHWVTRSMPRFLWRATAARKNARVIDLFFDATDLHTSNGVHGVLCYDKELGSALALIAADPNISTALDSLPGALRILRWLHQHRPESAS